MKEDDVLGSFVDKTEFRQKSYQSSILQFSHEMTLHNVFRSRYRIKIRQFLRFCFLRIFVLVKKGEEVTGATEKG